MFVFASQLQAGGSRYSCRLGSKVLLRLVSFTFPLFSSNGYPKLRHVVPSEIAASVEASGRASQSEGAAHWLGLECRAPQGPQPERNARVRDVPKEAFFKLAQTWRQRRQATLVSMQLEGHEEQPVQACPSGFA